MMTDLNGYDYTYCDAFNSTNKNAFYYARNYNVSLPKTCSGWFVPSIGHWVCIIENLGKTDVRYTAKGIVYDQSTALHNLNKYGFIKDDYIGYWSSCEVKKYEGFKQDAWYVALEYGTIDYIIKATSLWQSVRAVAAF